MRGGEYEHMRRITYDGGKDDDGDYEGNSFIPVCEKCGRFVKADTVMRFQAETISDRPNATCSKCGRVQMLFEGFI